MKNSNLHRNFVMKKKARGTKNTPYDKKKKKTTYTRTLDNLEKEKKSYR